VKETLSGTGATTDWAEGAWSDVRGYPARVTWHQGRLAFARTDEEPQTVWLSQPFIFNDFTPGAEDDDAITAKLDTTEANDIKWIESSGKLLAGTFGGDFIVSSGASEDPLSPSNVSGRNQTRWGSLPIQPKKIGNYVYYVQDPGRKVREMYYFWDQNIYRSVDVTAFNEHLTKSGIVDIAFQRNPDSILWCVLANGKMATMVREVDQKVLSWTLQETNGDYESVISIPNANDIYDEVWTIVKRNINGSDERYIEYFVNPIAPDRQDQCFYVDSGLTLDTFGLTSTAGASITLSALTGSITVTSSAPYFSSGDVGRWIRATDQDTGEILGELAITGYTSPTQVTGTSRKDFDSLTYAAGVWGLSVNVVSGLGHLEGEEVSILADGSVQNFDIKKIVSSGEVTLDNEFFYITIGLQYISNLFTMPIEAGSATGTAQGKLKRIYQIGLKLYRTLGIEVGGDEDSLDIIQLRDPSTLMGTPEPLFTGEKANILLNANAGYEGQIYIRQARPLPMCILAIEPLVETWDR
jgi:hypothetical protein